MNITVNESPLKVVVGEKKEDDGYKLIKQNPKVTKIEWFRNCIENEIRDKTLSTPLPLVDDCVFINRKGELEWKII